MKNASRTGKWRAKVVDSVPLPALTHAHELAITGVLLVMGAPAMLGLLPGQGTPEDPLHFPMWEMWGTSMVASALLTHWGIFHNRPRAEWAGQMLAGWGLFFWSIVLLALLGLESYVTILVFLSLATVSWWRAFKITSAPYVQHRLTEAARLAHIRATEERKGGMT